LPLALFRRAPRGARRLCGPRAARRLAARGGPPFAARSARAAAAATGCRAQLHVGPRGSAARSAERPRGRRESATAGRGARPRRSERARQV